MSKKFTTKTISALLLGAVMVGSLTACGNSDEDYTSSDSNNQTYSYDAGDRPHDNKEEAALRKSALDEANLMADIHTKAYRAGKKKGDMTAYKTYLDGISSKKYKNTHCQKINEINEENKEDFRSFDADRKESWAFEATVNQQAQIELAQIRARFYSHSEVTIDPDGKYGSIDGDSFVKEDGRWKACL